MKVLTEFKSARGKYPWSKWTDGKTRSAIRGQDFQCTVRGFVSAVYMHADRHGFKVQVSDKGNGRVDFKFSKKRKK